MAKGDFTQDPNVIGGKRAGDITQRQPKAPKKVAPVAPEPDATPVAPESEQTPLAPPLPAAAPAPTVRDRSPQQKKDEAIAPDGRAEALRNEKPDTLEAQPRTQVTTPASAPVAPEAVTTTAVPEAVTTTAVPGVADAQPAVVEDIRAADEVAAPELAAMPAALPSKPIYKMSMNELRNLIEERELTEAEAEKVVKRRDALNKRKAPKAGAAGSPEAIADVAAQATAPGPAVAPPGDGGSGNVPPPGNPPSDVDPEGAPPSLLNRTRKKIEATVIKIRESLERGRFLLSGDDISVDKYSQKNWSKRVFDPKDMDPESIKEIELAIDEVVRYFVTTRHEGTPVTIRFMNGRFYLDQVSENEQRTRDFKDEPEAHALVGELLELFGMSLGENSDFKVTFQERGKGTEEDPTRSVLVVSERQRFDKKRDIIKHSDEVEAEIDETLAFFGQKRTDYNECRLFEAFQIYRGVSVDRDGNVFGKDEAKLVITDEVFVEFLREIRRNTLKHNHPFAYTNTRYRFGGRERYVGLTTRRLAEFFTENMDQNQNALHSNVKDFIDYSIEQTKGAVNTRLRKRAQFDQRESMYDLIEAASEGIGDDLKLRDINGRMSVSEVFNAEDEIARANNDVNKLIENGREQDRREKFALEQQDRKNKNRGSRDEVLSPDEAVAEPTTFFGNVTHRPMRALKSLTAYIRTVAMLGMPGLILTGAPEHAIGLEYQSRGLRALTKQLYGSKAEAAQHTVTQASIDRMTEPEMIAAVEEVIRLLVAKGRNAVIEAAVQGVRFDKTGLEAVRAGGANAQVGTFAHGGRDAQDFAMSLTTGDWFGKPETVKLFLEFLLYAYAYNAKNHGGIEMSRETMEALIENNPNEFLRKAVTTEEGMAALRFAADASLSGTDPITETLRKTVANEVTDFAVGFWCGWFLKFGIRGAIRIIPFSNTLIAAIKLGVINPARFHLSPISRITKMRRGLTVDGVKQPPLSDDQIAEVLRGQGKSETEIRQLLDEVDEAAMKIEESNEFMLAGNEDIKVALAQNLTVDLARFKSQVAISILAWAIVAAFGVEEPDDDELDHLWYEWKVGGLAIKENWFFQETLGFSMPFAIAMQVGVGDLMNGRGTTRSTDILVNGIASKLGDNPWMNIADMLDMIANGDRRLREAQMRAEGFEQEGELSAGEFYTTEFMAFITKRMYQSFEPAVIRQFYNEHSVLGGESDLAHSVNVVYTTAPNDTPEGEFEKTKQTTWSDARKRRTAYQSPLTGFVMNLFSGYYLNNPGVQQTGYMKDEMPLVTNSDEGQMMWYNRLSVIDENGEAVPPDYWTEEQHKAVVNEVIALLNRDSASQLAADGVVIPYDARDQTTKVLYEQARQITAAFKDRDAAGEWTVNFDNYSGGGGSIALNKAKADRQAAYEIMYAEKQAVYALIDKLFDDAIPYSARKYNRWETNYVPLYTWKKDGLGHSAGQPATAFDYLYARDEIEFTMYARGDHKSSMALGLIVDDRGNTYDAQTQAAYQNEYTDEEQVRADQEGYTIPRGMNKGRNLWDLTSGGGKTGPGSAATNRWDNEKLLSGARAYVPAEMPSRKIKREDYADLAKAVTAEETKKVTTPAGGGGGGGWGGGGGGGYSARIYSHAPYNLNTDKAAGLYSKVPYSARFDYLRPKVLTKGSREAYRREDF